MKKDSGLNKDQTFFNNRNVPNWRSILWIILFWIVAAYFFRPFAQSNSIDIPYSRFKEYVTQGNISEITVKGQIITGKFNKPVKKQIKGGKNQKEEPSYSYFKTLIPSFGDPEIMKMLEGKNVVINAETQDKSWLSTLLIGMLPWVIIIGFFI